MWLFAIVAYNSMYSRNQWSKTKRYTSVHTRVVFQIILQLLACTSCIFQNEKPQKQNKIINPVMDVIYIYVAKVIKNIYNWDCIGILLANTIGT